MQKCHDNVILHSHWHFWLNPDNSLFTVSNQLSHNKFFSIIQYCSCACSMLNTVYFPQFWLCQLLLFAWNYNINNKILYSGRHFFSLFQHFNRMMYSTFGTFFRTFPARCSWQLLFGSGLEKLLWIFCSNSCPRPRAASCCRDALRSRYNIHGVILRAWRMRDDTTYMRSSSSMHETYCAHHKGVRKKTGGNTSCAHIIVVFWFKSQTLWF